MRWYRVSLVLLALAVCAVLPIGTLERASAQSSQPQSTALLDELTAEIEREARTWPGVTGVKRTEPGLLAVKGSDGTELSVSVTNLANSVAARPAEREALVSNFVTAMRQSIGTVLGSDKEPALPFPQSLVPIVKPRVYIDNVKAQIRASGRSDLQPMLSKRLFGDLIVMVGADQGKWARFVLPGEGREHKLDDAAVFKRATENFKAKVLPTLKIEAEPPFRRLLIDGSLSYSASLLAIPEVWTTVANSLGNRFYVAVPDRETVLVLKPGDSAALAALRKAAAAPDLPYPISDQVLIWDRGTWSVLK